jgi:hypothetical protein
LSIVTVCSAIRFLDEFAGHFDALGNEIVGPLGRRPGFLAPLHGGTIATVCSRRRQQRNL